MGSTCPFFKGEKQVRRVDNDDGEQQRYRQQQCTAQRL
jgi:hypothetical protein